MKAEQSEDALFRRSTIGYLLFGFGSVAALVAGMMAWASLVPLSSAVIVPGTVEVHSNKHVVEHDEGGTVREILVEDGDFVKAGQTLIRLDSPHLRAELIIAESRVFAAAAARARLVAQSRGANASEIEFDSDTLFAAEFDSDLARILDEHRTAHEKAQAARAATVEGLEVQVAAFRSEIEAISRSRAAVARRLDLAKGMVERRQSLLDAEAGTQVQLEQAQGEVAAHEERLGELDTRVASLRGRVAQAEADITRLSSQWVLDALEALVEVRANEAALRESLAALRKRVERLEVTAPVSGTVFSLAVSAPPSEVGRGEPLLHIVPADRPLVVTGQVARHDIDEIHEGGEVRLRLSSLPQSTTPELNGTVTLVSADAVVEEGALEPFFTVEIVFDDGELERLPEGVTVFPGLPVEALVRTAERTALEYLFKPLSDNLARAFVES